ncbi:NADH:ubiquinone reductase (Na(+)-transporting) subunit B [Rehaibacterium terrae]|jgi:Na+-transporting NADH:ubiquinone oxidoreductase subunit B|uniref:Na(+)-translocating NADH-quinone reductase subunit B n=1 Tax=Rehaibacterium terrae TaxID=1341696 RepID=A0A7W7Y1P2_9GAMM|nr:NADH:ubiquinone reductase (Na(+)-transporting) subunit B [Rehaibacterium terrae]MBB5016228.1 Na+-transporting NADH:ubiquinone oxidoreductase subunit B [Rehaibacterium terrae]
MGLRAFIDRRIAPHFHEGGRLHRFYVFYEMFDTMLYSPASTTRGPTHVRDGIDLKRVMMTVWLCALPALFFGLYNTGYQANLQITQFGYSPIPGWRSELVAALTGFDHLSLAANLLHGAVYYVPIFIVTYLGGFIWEGLFAWKRGHEVNEGFFVTGILFTLILPPTIPLWQVFLGISFGVVVGKEVFGGTGKNFLNPALVGRAFLFFAYPAQMSGDVWTAVDGFTGATPLALAAAGELDFSVGLGANAAAAAGVDLSWMQTALGGIQGSIGETSTVLIALAGLVLAATKIASWRIMLSMLLGMMFLATVFNWIGSQTNPMFAMPWYWHLTLGGFAFGLVYMATDPVSASMTNAGKWVFGALIGMMTVLIRVVNPAFPEGVMLAILFGNLCAPLIDHFVVQANIRRRQRRLREASDGH